MPLKIAAFPKCYIDQIAGERSMSVFDWIEMARSLDADGLEMYDGFFTSLEPSYLDQVGEAIAAAGFAMPMLCCSPDFTNPDPDARKRAVDREAELIAGGPPAGRPAHGLPGALRPALPGNQPPARARVGRRLHQPGPAGRPRARHRPGPGEPLQGRLLEVSRIRPENGPVPRAGRVDPRPRSFRSAIRPVERDRRRRRPDRVIASRRAAGRQHARQRPIAGRGDDARRPPPDRRYAGLFA